MTPGLLTSGAIPATSADTPHYPEGGGDRERRVRYNTHTQPALFNLHWCHVCLCVCSECVCKNKKGDCHFKMRSKGGGVMDVVLGVFLGTDVTDSIFSFLFFSRARRGDVTARGHTSRLWRRTRTHSRGFAASGSDRWGHAREHVNSGVAQRSSPTSA